MCITCIFYKALQYHASQFCFYFPSPCPYLSLVILKIAFPNFYHLFCQGRTHGSYHAKSESHSISETDRKIPVSLIAIHELC